MAGSDVLCCERVVVESSVYMETGGVLGRTDRVVFEVPRWSSCL